MTVTLLFEISCAASRCSLPIHLVRESVHSMSRPAKTAVLHYAELVMIEVLQSNTVKVCSIRPLKYRRCGIYKNHQDDDKRNSGILQEMQGMSEEDGGLSIYSV